MNKTHRDINGIDKASQKGAWKRPLNHGVQNVVKGNKTTGDSKPNRDRSGSVGSSKSLNSK